MTIPTDASSIGAQVRALREARGWSQKELADKAGIDASLISRLEAGQYVNPRANTVAKLETAFAIPSGSLVGESKLRVSQSESGIRFLLPHSTVAAPFYSLALGGEIEGVSFSSCKSGKAATPPGELIWLPTSDDSVPDTGPSKIQPLLSLEARSLLDRGEADMMLAWSAGVEAYEGIFKRYAQVVFGLTTLNCLRVFPKQGSKGSNRFPAIYPKGLDNIVRQYAPRFDHNTEIVTDFAEWPEFVEQVKVALHEHGEVAVFIWEPCASWLQEALGSEEYSFHFEIPLGMDLEKKNEPPPIYSVMDIVCRAEDARILQWLAEERKKTSGFFARLKASIKQVQSAVKEEQFTLQPVPMIAKYLHMPENTVRWRLRRLDFGVRFYD